MDSAQAWPTGVVSRGCGLRRERGSAPETNRSFLPMSHEPEPAPFDAEEFLRLRRDAGQGIDPATAEVDWSYGQVLDPYGIDPDLPEELYCAGRVYFARAPGSDLWVWFGDVADATRGALERSPRNDDFWPFDG
jgi:hypothetical protein